MNVNDATRLRAIVDEMAELLDEAKRFCSHNMTPEENKRFSYNTLAHLEPGLLFGTSWVTNAVPLEKVADTFLEAAQAEEDAENGEEE